MLELKLQALEGLPKNGETDPIEYYRHPLVGPLYRERINQGLRLLPQQGFGRALEVGYGAGALQLVLSQGVGELHGIDLDADPNRVAQFLRLRNCNATLVQGSVYELPYPAEHFDLVVSFSVFEHLQQHRTALQEVFRVLRPGGLFLLGMPAVNKMMEAGFLAIGFKGINDHHITRPEQVEKSFCAVGFRLVRKTTLDFPLRRPLGLRLYYNWLLERPQAVSSTAAQ